MPDTKSILFLCTGNYYRSRFAEMLFNHLASQMSLDYSASSRALNIAAGSGNIGPISKHTLVGLQERNVDVPKDLRYPAQASGEDFERAKLVVALKEAEHRPMVALRFPSRVDRVEYWHVHDLDMSHPTDALWQIEQKVRELLHRLQLAENGTS